MGYKRRRTADGVKKPTYPPPVGGRPTQIRQLIRKVSVPLP